MSTDQTRRHFFKLGSIATAAQLFPSTVLGKKTEPKSLSNLLNSRLDYSKAKATPTICFGCTNHCGVIGWVQDGTVRKIEGNPLDPNTEGNLCAKAQGMISYTYYPERILYPMERVGKRGEGKWKRISWDEAYEKIAAKLKPLREKGVPEEFIFHYGRDKTKGYTKHFTNAFGTPHRLNRRSICSSNRRAPLMSFYGRDFEWETQDLENTKYIVNWGGNPYEAYQGGLFMAHRMQKAIVDHGAKLVTFEVRPSATASKSTEYHPVMPGTDGAIAFAMIHTILKENLQNDEFWNAWTNYSLDELREDVKDYTPEWAEKLSGVKAEHIRRIAIEFAQAAPACCTMSNRGSAKHYNGMQADRAIRTLDVLVGNVGKKGGYCLSSLRGWSGQYGQEGLPKLTLPEPKAPSPKPWGIGEGFNETAFKKLSKEVQDRVNNFPDKWKKKYFGELATPSEFPLSWHWYSMRVGQLVYPYIAEGRQKVSAYMSFTLGASYGYPEANVVREVLRDEEKVPFHVAIDIGYGEQAALADIVLPEATSLERWDYHSTNCYGLVPYTGVRQPLAKPMGESKSIQVILRELAHRIGGGMEKHFTYKDDESLYKDWYKNLPISWEEFKRRGIWQDKTREKDYELYNRPLTEAELKGATVQAPAPLGTKAKASDAPSGPPQKPRNTPVPEPSGTGPNPFENGKTYPDRSLIIGAKGKPVGIVMDGKPVRGFPTPTRLINVYDPVFEEAAIATGLPLSDGNSSPVAKWHPVPEHIDLADDRYIFSTFKWNVHTQGRSGHWKYSAEIVHTNPAFMHPDTGKKLGLKEGDRVKISVYRPKGHTYRSGEKGVMGSFENHVRFLDGMHQKVVMCSHHVGHFEHGYLGESKNHLTSPTAGKARPLEKLAKSDNIWWSKKNGGIGGGVHINDALPINPAPLIGGQNWYDNVCKIEKVTG